ncbi:MAG: HEPN domain-containing protein [Chloroflexi bacterium]|nr:HEPN domain-containing protein [Chloroflexota bacterium]
MNPEVKALIEKAKRSRKAAENLFKDGDVDFSASRAYYSMFYTASALLLSRGLSFSSHSGVIANFGKEFAKTGAINPKYHNYLIDAQDRRNIGDYEIVFTVTDEQAKEMLAWAAEFIAVAEEYINNHPQSGN